MHCMLTRDKNAYYIVTGEEIHSKHDLHLPHMLQVITNTEKVVKFH